MFENLRRFLDDEFSIPLPPVVGDILIVPAGRNGENELRLQIIDTSTFNISVRVRGVRVAIKRASLALDEDGTERAKYWHLRPDAEDAVMLQNAHRS